MSLEYYHILIETKTDYKRCYEWNCTNKDYIIESILTPFFRNEEFFVNGFIICKSNVSRLIIKLTNENIDDIVNKVNANIPSNVICFVSRENVFENRALEVTKELMSEAKLRNSFIDNGKKGIVKTCSKVFIVHGHDKLAKTEVARFIEKLGFEAIILSEQPNEGKTIIEKIESYTNVAFGIVLYTPCDIGFENGTSEQKARARQNVVFEHGFLIGKLGREHVHALKKGELETPNDISGIVYTPMDDGNAWQLAVAKEMKKVGYDIDLNKLF